MHRSQEDAKEKVETIVGFHRVRSPSGAGTGRYWFPAYTAERVQKAGPPSAEQPEMDQTDGRERNSTAFLFFLLNVILAVPVALRYLSLRDWVVRSNCCSLINGQRCRMNSSPQCHPPRRQWGIGISLTCQSDAVNSQSPILAPDAGGNAASKPHRPCGTRRTSERGTLMRSKIPLLSLSLSCLNSPTENSPRLEPSRRSSEYLTRPSILADFVVDRGLCCQVALHFITFHLL